MATRKLQIYLSEPEYQYLRQAAGEHRSMASVVRQLIEEAGQTSDVIDDPFYRHIMLKKKRGGRLYDAEQAKRELYKRPR
jgi:hypothetical protein